MTLDAGLYHLSIKLSMINIHWEMTSRLTVLLGEVNKLKGLNKITYNNLLFCVEIFFPIINIHLNHCESMNSRILCEF